MRFAPAITLCHLTDASHLVRRIQKLSSELGVPISLPQLIQAHTPFREYAEKYGDKPVLVVGGRDNKCREVAESYGFKQAYTPWDVLNWDESIWPFRSVGEQQKDFVKVGDFDVRLGFASVDHRQLS